MKNNNKNNNEITIKTIWKWLRSKKGKRYSFVIFYIFFFIFLYIFMNVDLKTDTNKKEETPKEDTSALTSLPFVTSNLENSNYSFTYNITCPSKTIYNVKKEDKIYTFSIDNKNYKYELINGELTTNEEKINYIDFSNIYFLKQVIKNSKYISETKLAESEEYIYTYEINNNTLINYLDEELDVLETSEIKVKTNSKKIIKEIEINIKGENICIIKEQVEE